MARVVVSHELVEPETLGVLLVYATRHETVAEAETFTVKLLVLAV